MTLQEAGQFPPKGRFLKRFEPGEFKGQGLPFVPESGAAGHVDLRERNLVSPVRQQLPCTASCTSFGFASLIENHHLRKDGSAYEVAAGWIHSCKAGLNCEQGMDPSILAGLISQSAVPPASSGPFPWPKNACAVDTTIAVPQLKPVSGVFQFKNALFYGSVVAAAMLVDDRFEDWDGVGIYSVETSEKAYDHVVTIVGYDDRQKYWICKNSLGPDWGDHGYFLASFDSAGIAVYSAYTF